MRTIIESEVKEFISKLPELSTTPPTTHLLMLAIRSRIAKRFLNEKIKDLLVERRIIRNIPDWRTRYFNHAYNYSLLQQEGNYNYREVPQIPNSARAIYGTLSPRDVFKAVSDLMKETVDYLYQRDESANMQIAKQSTRFFGALHRHKAQGHFFVTLDLDVQDLVILRDIQDVVSSLPVWMITETSRGYHVILDLSKSSDAAAFFGENKIAYSLRIRYADKGLELQKDSQEPLPGTRYDREDGSIHYVSILR